MTTMRAQPTTLTTAADALRGEEVDRTRAFIQVGWFIAVAVAAATLALPGDPRIRTALLGTLGVAVLGSIWLHRQLADRASYQARVMHVVALLSRDFLKLVIISLMLAIPISAYAMNIWLEGFAYRVGMQWWTFLSAAVISLVIALLTVSAQAIRAAVTDPAKSLRSE